MTYTGNEPVNVTFFKDGEMNSEGETLYSKTLREFMCAIISNLQLFNHLGTVTQYAHELTIAYIDQLNKNQQL